ncbi:MAG: helix-turn-helix domain-containing protein [Candidatus Acidiferrales bacterium]
MPKKAKPSEYIPVAPSPTQSFLTVKNAAAYLGATVSFVRHQLVYAKAVPYTRLGKRIVFAKADLDAYMAQRIAA